MGSWSLLQGIFQTLGSNPDLPHCWRVLYQLSRKRSPQWRYVEQNLGNSEGQGSLACCGPWGCKELDMTQQLNSNNMKNVKVLIIQSCLILCDPMDGSPPGSSVHGILQARSLEWVTTIYMSNLSNCTLKWIYFIDYKPYPNKTDLKYVLRDKFCILNECLSKTSGEWKWKWSRSVMSDSLRPHGL